MCLLDFRPSNHPYGGHVLGAARIFGRRMTQDKYISKRGLVFKCHMTCEKHSTRISLLHHVLEPTQCNMQSWGGASLILKQNMTAFPWNLGVKSWNQAQSTRPGLVSTCTAAPCHCNSGNFLGGQTRPGSSNKCNTTGDAHHLSAFGRHERW